MNTSSKESSYWTVQLLPSGSSPARAFRLHKRTAKVAGLGGAVLALCGLAFVVGAFGRFADAEELARYRAENAQLIASLNAMGDQSGELGRALDDLSQRETRFRLLAGLPLIDPDVYSVGVGGPGGGIADDEFFGLSPNLAREAGDVAVNLAQLLRLADLLSASLDEAADSVETNRDRYRRLPSVWPVLAADAWISSGFSHDRLHPTLGYRRPHYGVDISAAHGSPVIATGAGRVTFAGPRSGYGRLVIIDHGGGYESRYGHLGRINVRAGHAVTRGDIIGEVSDSGTTTGPNLHYEVRVQGRPIDPQPFFLDRSYRAQQ